MTTYSAEPPRQRRTRRPGYTMIEVMMAIGVMTVGSMGIYALQQAVLRGNQEARQMTVATNLAYSWANRLKRDALTWNTEGAGGLTNTTYLSGVPLSPEVGEWVLPVPVTSAESYAFDYLGNDTRAEGDIMYCTNVRLRWAVPDQAIRADIRVWWARASAGSSDETTDMNLYDLCVEGTADGVSDEISEDASRLRAVYDSVVLRWSAIQ